jgi:L-ascorbate metabolism protein UlaG (beta-lactamase superfamily)
MHITMIGHSTVLLESDGTRLLTDPYFGTFGHIAYARITPPAITWNEIGRLDGVLVSHGHWDHTDRRFFRGLDPAVPVVVPSGMATVMRLKGARTIVPIGRWQSIQVGAMAVTAVPAAHIARTAGFVVQTERVCVYFAGDTYYRPFMAEIGRRFPIDVALIPVTTYRIPMTMGEKGAVLAARDLGYPTVIPIHLGIQPRSPLLRTRQSPAGFERRLREHGIETEVVVLANGETWEVERRPAPSDISAERADISRRASAQTPRSFDSVASLPRSGRHLTRLSS